MKSSNRRIAKGAAAAALTALDYAGVAFAQSWPGAWTVYTSESIAPKQHFARNSCAERAKPSSWQPWTGPLIQLLV